MIQFKTVLYPTDFSKPSECAFDAAATLARQHGARLLILHVTQPGVAYAESVPLPKPTPEEIARPIWDTFHKLEALDPTLRDVRVETRLAEGDPALRILERARSENADLIVMGTHGRSGISRLLFGSTAEQVLREAPCPVITVRDPSTVRPERATDPVRLLYN